MEDQAGFEPALGLRRRIKSPVRSAATVTGPAYFPCGDSRASGDIEDCLDDEDRRAKLEHDDQLHAQVDGGPGGTRTHGGLATSG